MGLFNRFKLDIKPLTKAPVASFKDSFNVLASQLVDNKLDTAKSSASYSKEDFRTLWGIEMSSELEDLYDKLLELKIPTFDKWESALPNLEIAHQKGNIFSDVLLKAQVEFPTDHHISWFTGSISLDPMVNSGNKWNGQNYSFQYPLYDILDDDTTSPQIYMYQHNHPDMWSSSFEVMSKDIASFLYVVMMMQAHTKKKLSNADFVICFDKIKDKVKIPYDFFNSFRANGRWISYYDFNYRPSSNRGSTLTLDYYNRSRWIFELLKGNHDNNLWSLQHSFYPKYLNPDLDAERHRMNLEHLPTHVPDALYYLMRCFFRNETKQLKEYINVCKSSDSRIIKDAALFAEDLDKGLEFFGEIENLQTLKREFNQNMNW